MTTPLLTVDVRTATTSELYSIARAVDAELKARDRNALHKALTTELRPFLDTVETATRKAVKLQVFTTEYDNGWFFDGYAALTLSDGSLVGTQLAESGEANEMLTMMAESHGPLSNRSEVVVNLTTGVVTVNT